MRMSETRANAQKQQQKYGRKLLILKGEVRSIFIFWYFILYNMKILST